MEITLIDILAVWGAVVGTGVLIWDIYKHKTSGARVILTMQSNMMFYGFPDRDGKTHIVFEVVNRGNRPCTIESAFILHFKTSLRYAVYRLFRRRRRADESLFVKAPGISNDIPHVLNPGCIWKGAAIQNEEIKSLGEKGVLLGAIFTSESKRPKTTRIRFKGTA